MIRRLEKSAVVTQLNGVQVNSRDAIARELNKVGFGATVWLRVFDARTGTIGYWYADP